MPEIDTLLEELRMVRYLEKDTGDLMDIHPSILTKVRDRMDKIRSRMRSGEMPTKEEMEEVESIRYTLEEVFCARLHKIILLARDDAECNTSSDPSPMLGFERDFYQTVVDQATQYLRQAGVKP